MKKKNYVLDTNVLLYDPKSIFQFQENIIHIPMPVLEELDTFKSSTNELGMNARETIRYLDSLREKGKLCNGVELAEGGTLFVKPYQEEDASKYMLDRNYVDNKILLIANQISQERKNVVLVTKDINLRIKADSLGLDVEDYKKPHEDKYYSGVAELTLSKEELDELYEEKFIDYEMFSEEEFNDNQYLIIHSAACKTEWYSEELRQDSPEEYVKDYHNRPTIAKFIEDKICLIGNGITTGKELVGIKPKNMRQEFLVDALIDPDINLITIEGKAGTGKSLLATAGAMSGYFNCAYDKIVITRPIVSLGKELGHLPGDIEAKMHPWMQPIFDAIDIIKKNHSGFKNLETSYENYEEGDIHIAPLSFIRGRNFHRAIMIVDEAQNLSPHEIKTIVTRAGEDTKLIFTGDPEQIDVPYFDRSSNGFSYLIKKFKGQRIYSHVTLTDGERSELAELAARLL